MSWKNALVICQEIHGRMALREGSTCESWLTDPRGGGPRECRDRAFWRKAMVQESAASVGEGSLTQG